MILLKIHSATDAFIIIYRKFFEEIFLMNSAEARPGCSQASKINLFARIVNVFKFVLSRVPSWMFEEL